MNEIKMDHELGYTETNLRASLSPQEFARFILWMRGQTFSMVNGEPVYYLTDFQRWLKAEPIID